MVSSALSLASLTSRDSTWLSVCLVVRYSAVAGGRGTDGGNGTGEGWFRSIVLGSK